VILLKAKEQIESYIGHLPFEVRVAVSSLNKILYNLYNIQSLEAAKIEGRHVSDTNRIQALSVMKDVVKMKIDVLTNTATLKEALSFVEDKRAEIQKYRSEIDRIAIEDKQQVTVDVDVDVDNNINDAIIEQTTNKEDQNVSITGSKYYNDKDNYNLNQEEEEQLALEDRGITTTTTKEEENDV
jgi:ribosomal protein L31E